ncbi:hypothetical protein GM661_07880 [Iocasia frigidifontis]|uniref:Uncharacterized protein n=1 Tax=Iocasia fonsfrigidae TaxID=2682810 RepID=A0A8A7K846_9FIRM|nr:hypothetical protein [Iocasia fonsfrigidae]QTL97906.1 hypothetical protein GM661_07880 [Iocasia fonsfrigidae]
MKEIITPFIENPVEYAFAYVLLVMIIWLFININLRIEKIEVKNIDRNDVFLTKCGKLLFLLKSEKDNKEKIEKIISEMVPYTSETFMNSLLSWESERDKIIIEIQDKMTTLKREQELFIYKDDLTTLKLFRKGIFISGLSNYIKSFIFLCFILLLILISFVAILEAYTNGTFAGILFISPYFCFILWVITFWEVYDTHKITKSVSFDRVVWFILYSLLIFIGIIIIALRIRYENNLVYIFGIITYLVLYYKVLDLGEFFELKKEKLDIA